MFSKDFTHVFLCVGTLKYALQLLLCCIVICKNLHFSLIVLLRVGHNGELWQVVKVVANRSNVADLMALSTDRHLLTHIQGSS